MSRFLTVLTVIFICFVPAQAIITYTIDSPEIITALEKAGDNAGELQKAIYHYTNDANNQELTALLFLIANMEDQSYATYRMFDTANVDVDFNVLDYPNYDSLTASVKEIEKVRGELDFEKKELIYDLEHITADFLITQIDYAFKAWEERPWSKNYNFDQFCRYILPYRGSNEPLEEWRQYFYEKYAHIVEQMKNPTNPLEAAALINDDIKTWFGFDPRYYYHPTDLGLSEMLSSKLGRCEDMTNVTIYAMRANGLAVTSDYTPYWANSGNNHAWNAIVTAEGDVIPFMGAEASPGTYQLSGKVGKVYRKTYDQQKDNLVFQVDSTVELPGWLKGKYYTDVTKDYTDVADVEFRFYFSSDKVIKDNPYSYKYEMSDNGKYIVGRNHSESNNIVYLCVFNSGEWKPIHWAKIKDNKAICKDMGTGVMYLPAFYQNGEIIPIDSPFLLNKDGSKNHFSVMGDVQIDMKLFSTTKRKLVESTDGIQETFFENGKKYELFYWNDGNEMSQKPIGWISSGISSAIDNKPLYFTGWASGLYWLVEEGSDKEERIFTIDKDGNQVWW